METTDLSIITAEQYQFLASREPRGYYDNRTREQLYSLIDKLVAHKKQASKEELRLYKRFQHAEFGILLPGDRKTSGPLKFKVSLCLDGEHEGDITTGGTLIINEKGSVQGNISAAEIICKGKIEGKRFGWTKADSPFLRNLVGRYGSAGRSNFTRSDVSGKMQTGQSRAQGRATKGRAGPY